MADSKPYFVFLRKLKKNIYDSFNTSKHTCMYVWWWKLSFMLYMLPHFLYFEWGTIFAEIRNSIWNCWSALNLVYVGENECISCSSQSETDQVTIEVVNWYISIYNNSNWYIDRDKVRYLTPFFYDITKKWF